MKFRHLQDVLKIACERVSEILEWGILLEFTIPRKEKRIDAVLLTGSEIVLLEVKRGKINTDAKRQVEEYALLLHYFHKASHEKRIIPIVVSDYGDETNPEEIVQAELDFKHLPSYWIARTSVCLWDSLASVLAHYIFTNSSQVDIAAWDRSPYHPVPSIIEAALALRGGLSIREIAHSESSEYEIESVVATLQDCVQDAKTNHRLAICFVTGVPGSGKTLVGLTLAHSSQARDDHIHFMSGNGPLVRILQYLFRKQARSKGNAHVQANVHAGYFVDNVHRFANHYAEEVKEEVPDENVVIFDEAQRAWDREQNKRKFKRDYSEPEMLLSIMERRNDWAVVIALVGGGQEINSGEAGLYEWGKALQLSQKQWKIYASPEVLSGGESTAGQMLFDANGSPSSLVCKDTLHLRTSNRSLRAENIPKWVNAVIDGDADLAMSMNVAEKFPLYLTRSITTTKRVLYEQSLGDSRYGLVGSSGAIRLRAEGLEPDTNFHANYKWECWYLSPRTDVRASYACEVFATEFEIQGLELDWIGLCWGGDFIWDPLMQKWQTRKFVNKAVSAWGQIKDERKQMYRRNAYRVLLTRARQGMLIYVPVGSNDDPTRNPAEFDATAQFLIDCGVRPL